MSLSKNIKTRRMQLGMSQQDLATQIGYKSRSAIAKIESGTSDVPVSKLLVLARALDTTVDALLRGEGSLDLGRGNAPWHYAHNASARPSKVSSIVLAGGKSTRSQRKVPNQFVNVMGKPILIYSLEAYQRHPLVDEIVVVCLNEWIDVVEGYIREYGITKTKSVDIVSAGDSGLESIRRGLRKIVSRGYDRNDIVIVQEATRPFVSEETISKLLSSCFKYGSSVICESLEDHLPFVRDPEGAMSYVDRHALFSMQSPDAHRVETLLDAFSDADAMGLNMNENCCGMLLRNLGMPLRFCEGGHNNVKIVRSEDLAIFAALLKQSM